MSDIKSMVRLIESIQLDEGRHDNAVKEAIQSLKKIVSESDYEKSYMEFIEKAEGAYKRALNTNGFKNIPNSWKLFHADATIAIIYSHIVSVIAAQINDEAIYKNKKLLKRIDKLSQINEYINKIIMRNRGSNASISIESIGQRIPSFLVHFNGINIEKIQKANPYNSQKDFMNILRELEEEFIAISDELVEPSGDEKIILDLGQYKWFDLGRPECDDEGTAMGHCGNSGSPKSGDTIYSLRQVIEKNGETFHRPSLTFIVNGGILGEMKGRANQKPNKKYHPYIMALLKSDYIEGIFGGGYRPQHNFELSDLSEEDIEELKNVKGEKFLERVTPLRSIIKRYKENGADMDMLGEIDEFVQEEIGVESPFILSNNKLVVDLEHVIKKEYSNIYEIVFGEEFNEIDTPIPESYDEYLTELDDDDYDKVVEYLMVTFGDDIKTKADEEGEDYGELFVRNNMDEIVDELDIDTIKDAVERAVRDAYEIGTMNEISDAMKNAIKHYCAELNLSIPENMFTLYDDMDMEVVIEPKDLELAVMGFIENEVEFKIDEPLYGFEGYDDSIVKESLSDALYEEGVLEYEDN